MRRRLLHQTIVPVWLRSASVLSLLFWSCSEATAPEDQLVATVQAEPAAVEAGDSVVISIAVINRAGRSLTVTTPSSCLFTVRIRDEGQKTVDQLLTGTCIHDTVTNHRISPDFSLELETTWHTDVHQLSGMYTAELVVTVFERGLSILGIAHIGVRQQGIIPASLSAVALQQALIAGA